MDNKFQYRQNAAQIDEMREFAIECLMEKAVNYTDPGSASLIAEKARKIGLYEVADEIMKSFNQGTKDYQAEIIERRNTASFETIRELEYFFKNNQ